ncbi:MAG: KOW motif-containing protein, partial [Planctomycetaceae bacterium]|nr:KOW motif-containing protein [Planctomycetaceae bacterium]
SAGLDSQFGEMVIPVEKIQEIKGGRKRERERKVYPGYIYLEVETKVTDDPDDKYQMGGEAYFIVKETPGVGDFVGDRNKPVPMSSNDVQKILKAAAPIVAGEEPAVAIDLKKGDPIKIKDGPFENFEGVVDEVIPAKGLVRVTVTIFGRATPLELEYWQVGKVT